jgi:L-ascorbate metabolism protein UlaG (beta-lactamase superfamily)
VHITLIGGPTALLEISGLRFLTDPTFDSPGSEFAAGPVTLRKTIGPAVASAELEQVDAVLLSHDQHFDNLDHAGRAFLPRAGRVLTTPAGAARLRNNAVGLRTWETLDIPPERGGLRITATPARHGPPGIEPVSGEVTGFVIQSLDNPGMAVYVTGDTVWYEGVAEVARRFRVSAIVLFAGAARVKARGPEALTMTHEDPDALIFPVHHSGWEHFSENLQTLKNAFAHAGLSQRLRPIEPGVRTEMVPRLGASI